MRINYLEYHDRESGWQLERTTFKDLTLLVGASGAGKTRILRAIRNLKHIATKNLQEGWSFNGIGWEIGISIDGKDYYWKGQFQDSESGNKKNHRKNYFEFEEVKRNGKVIALRNSNGEIYFEENQIPRLPLDQSLVSLFKEEKKLNPVYSNFFRIIESDSTRDMFPADLIEDDFFNYLVKEYNSIEKIKNSKENIYTKLALASINAPNIFKRILYDYQAIFPNIEEVIIEVEPAFDGGIVEQTSLSIREKGVKNVIYESNISAGMYKTLILLAEIYLSPDGTIILIDEFENSLGVNCINPVTSAILNLNRDIQFILTSHHPYIINKIDLKYWKIISRKGSVVTAKDASEFDLGRSRHDHFFQLLQLEEYQTGVAV